MSPNQLTDEQRKVVHDLQKEIDALNVKADVQWAKYLHTKDEDCFNEVLALESEIEMKGLIAYIPKGGERKIDRVRDLIRKAKESAGVDCPDCDLGSMEPRVAALRSINEWRETYDLPPLDRLPRGVPGDSHNCTLAMALQQTAQDLQLESGEVSVQDGSSIKIEGYRDGEWFSAGNFLDEKSASAVINDFDQNAWLDLLDDNSLIHYAETVAGNDDAEHWGDRRPGRLQEISDEMAGRDISHNVSLYNWNEDGDETEPEPELGLGKDAKPIEEQLACGAWRVGGLERQLAATKARPSAEEEERDRIEAELRSLRDE